MSTTIQNIYLITQKILMIKFPIKKIRNRNIIPFVYDAAMAAF